MDADSPLTYKDAGVDIDKGDELVERIKGPVKETQRSEVIGGLGGFGALFAVPSGYRDPILVASTDGVGTKLKLAMDFDAHDNVGIDLVAMCVNDLIVQGAEPLFFLDYYSTRKLDLEVAERVIRGIAHGCKIAGAALIGGETAEHPGMGVADEYDLAGFSVGIVERDGIIDGRTVAAGDAIIGIASSGPHSNGFSLIRAALDQRPEDARRIVAGRPLIEQLLEPTRIYVRALLDLFRRRRPKALAHITGGGLLENIPRVLPDGLAAQLDSTKWPSLPVFDWLAAAGVGRREMHRTFNCGIGMIVIVAREHAGEALSVLHAAGERAWDIGTITPATGELVVVS
jgi:phosphoribosylformylglycinamidine cyclo-ligase